jgi:hypothetical protein
MHRNVDILAGDPCGDVASDLGETRAAVVALE